MQCTSFCQNDQQISENLPKTYRSYGQWGTCTASGLLKVFKKFTVSPSLWLDSWPKEEKKKKNKSPNSPTIRQLASDSWPDNKICAVLSSPAGLTTCFCFVF